MKNQRGYIALISAIMISAVLIIISISISTTSFFSRFNVADAEYKKRSKALAEACIDQGLLKYAQDPSYTGNNEVVNVGSDTCKVVSVASSGSNVIVQAKGEFPNTANKAVTNIQVTVDSSSFALVSWEEIPNL